MHLHVTVSVWSLLISSVFSEFNISEFEYIGCYADDNGPRRLKGEFIKNPVVTQEMCLTTCRRREFRYAGLQNGNACFCGDETPEDKDKIPESECSVKCGGEITKLCGGGYRNAIYATFAVPPNYEYVGCYFDVPNRKMQGYFKTVEWASPKWCLVICRRWKYRYGGLQGGNECFCGNEELKCYEKKDDSDCPTTCTYALSSKCGGSYRNSIFTTAINWDRSYEYRPADFTYLGCYFDSSAEQRLRGESVIFAYMTQEMCLSYCSKRYFKYAGLQNGRKCCCGDETPAPVDVKPETECNLDCTGDDTKKCGGPSRNAVFSTGKVPPPSAYLGCYADENGYRRLKGYFEIIDEMAPRSCIDRCRRMGFKYAGLQLGNHCYCGNDVPNPEDKRIESECSVTCPGDYTSKCGAELRNSIYQTSADTSPVNKCPNTVEELA